MTAITLKLVAAPAARPAAAAVSSPSLGRVLAHRWDLFAVLGLLGSSAAYAVYALSHLA